MTQIHDAVRALGTAFTPEQVRQSIALFAPLLPSYDEATVVRDIAYGGDVRHRLDLFGIRAPATPRPVIVFIHGGGFVRGDKGGPADPFYSNVGAWAAAHGWLGCTATYRLAPENPWPAGADDVAAVISWLQANAGDYGGDPTRIVLIGQSAGAAHVGSYIGSEVYGDLATATLVGAIMMSGFFDPAHALALNSYETAYYGNDSGTFAARSSIDGLARTALPCLFTLSENDPETFQRQAALVIAARVVVQGKWPDFQVLAAQNHITPVHQIGTSVDEVGPVLKRFVDRVTR